MRVEQFLVETLRDISAKLNNNPSEYDLLKVSGLLRPILLDKQNVLDAASAAASHEVRFRVVEPGPLQIPPETRKQIDDHWDRFLAANPDAKRVDVAFSIRGDLLTGVASQPGDAVLELGRQDFLDHGIITYNDSDYTVENVLRVAANSLGGIHFDDTNWHPRSEELRKFMAGSEMFGRPLPAAMIFEIARCTLVACHPLAVKLHELGLYSDTPSDWVWGTAPPG